MLITPSALDAIFYSFDGRFRAAFERTPTFWQQLATEVPSTTRENRYHWLSELPRLKEWIGERVVRNLAARAASLVNKDWELTFGVDRDDIADDNIGVYNQNLDTLGEQARRWPDDLVLDALQAGGTGFSWDGQNFFDVDHPVNYDDANAGTYANLFTSTPLNAANYQAVRVAMAGIKGENGRPLRIYPNLLIVPPQLELQARQILNAEMIAPSGAFGINASGGFQTNVLRGSANMLVIPELASAPTEWYLADTSKAVKPLIFQNRQPPQFVQKTAPSDENVFWHRKFVYGVDARGAAGYSLPFLIAKAVA